MKSKIRKLSFVLAAAFVLLGLLVLATPARAATITATGSGNWNSTTNNAPWPGGVVPLATDTVVIPSGVTVTVNVAATCAGVTVNSGGILSINNSIKLTVNGSVSGAGQLTQGGTSSALELTGNWNFTGTYSHANRLTVTFSGSADQTIASTAVATWRVITVNKTGGTLFMSMTPTISTTRTFTAGNVSYNRGGAQLVLPGTYPANLTLSGSGIKTTSSVTVNGVLSMEDTATASAAPTYGSAATLQYNTATGRTAGVEWRTPFTATGGVVIANTGTITANAAKVLNASVPLSINSGATLATGNFQFTFGGNFVNNGGTFTAGSAPIVISNTMATQSIAGFTTTGLVSLTKTAGTATFTGNVNGGGLTINGSGGTLSLGTGLTHTFTGTWTRTAGTLNGGSSILNFSRAGTVSSGTGGTFTASTGTVSYNNAAAQTIAAVTYNNLTLSGGGVKTTTGATVNGILSLEGTATASAAPTYGAAATLQYKGNGAQTTGAEFTTPWAGTGGVKIENASGVTLNAIKTINATSSLTIGSSVSNSVFNDGGFQLTSTGTLNLNSGTFKLGSAGTATTFPAFTTRNILAGTMVEYAAGVAQTVSVTPSYQNLAFSGVGTKTPMSGTLSIAGNWSVGSTTALNTNNTVVSLTGNLTLSSGTLTQGTGAISIGGNWANNSSFTAGSGGVTLNGTGAQSIGGSTTTTFNNLTISNASGVNLSSSPIINETLALTNGRITTGSNSVIISAGGSVSGGSSSSYIIGNLEKAVATGATTRTFEVGATNYNPVTVTFGNVSTAGNLTVKATAGQHPDIGSSTIISSKDVNVYWSLTNSGIVFDNYNATFTFISGDIPGGANTANFIVGKYNGVWTYPTVGTKTSTTTQATGITSFSDFVVGESVPAAPTVVSAATDASGSTITITFSKAMADPSGKENQFKYQIGGGGDQTFSAAALNGDNTKIDLTTSGTAIAYGDAVTVSYAAGTVVAADTGVLATFSGQSVTNNVPAPTAPPVAVGGTVYPVNKAYVLLPWLSTLGILAVFAGLSTLLFIKKRRDASSL